MQQNWSHGDLSAFTLGTDAIPGNANITETVMFQWKLCLLSPERILEYPSFLGHYWNDKTSLCTHIPSFTAEGLLAHCWG